MYKNIQIKISAKYCQLSWVIQTQRTEFLKGKAQKDNENTQS